MLNFARNGSIANSLNEKIERQNTNTSDPSDTAIFLFLFLSVHSFSQCYCNTF